MDIYGIWINDGFTEEVITVQDSLDLERKLAQLNPSIWDNHFEWKLERQEMYTIDYVSTVGN